MALVRAGVRARAALGMALISLLVASATGIVTNQLVRRYLIKERTALGLRQAIVDAGVAHSVLSSGQSDPGPLVASLSGGRTRALLRVESTWYTGAVDVDEGLIPPGLLAAVDEGRAQVQRIRVSKVPTLLVGIPLPNVRSAYFEANPTTDLDRNLRIVTLSLGVAAGIAALTGAALGWWVSGRAVRPLREVAAVAGRIRSGARDARLRVHHDPELGPIATSFNEMLDDLDARVERERRFTADVSHELRTPLTTISAALSLAVRSAGTDTSAQALAMLDAQVTHLRRLVLDLLEISRFEAAHATLDVTLVDPAALVRHAVALRRDPVPVVDRLGDGRLYELDRRRVEAILATLLDNATRYADGASAIMIDRTPNGLAISVADHGPGVAEHERAAIFERLHRGTATARPGAPKGTGLGLALVAAHARLHGGDVSVTDNHGGGAVFTVRLSAPAHDVESTVD